MAAYRRRDGQLAVVHNKSTIGHKRTVRYIVNCGLVHRLGGDRASS